jgi:hypothetical protein
VHLPACLREEEEEEGNQVKEEKEEGKARQEEKIEDLDGVGITHDIKTHLKLQEGADKKHILQILALEQHQRA